MARCTPRSFSTGGLTSSGSTYNIVKPAGLTVGDLLVFIGISYGATHVNPAGWTQKLVGDAGTNENLCVFTKLATSGDVAATNFTFTMSVSTKAQGILYAVTAPDGTTPITAFHSSPGASDTGIVPGTQALLFIAAANIGNGASRTASAFAVANSNPSWTIGAFAGDGTIPMRVDLAYANSTIGTATGAASVSFSGATLSSTLAIFSIQPEVIRPTVLSAAATIGTAFTIQHRQIASVLSAALSIFGTQGSTLKQWTTQQKSAAGTYTNKQKS